MTEDARKLSHISVVSDDEDDVVIEAGAPRSRTYGEGDFATEPARGKAVAEGGEGLAAQAEQPDRASASAAFVAPERAAAPDDEYVSACAAKPAGKQAEKPARKASAPARQGYEETTLEDLESTKMSGMQKGIIAVALLGIAAFIVYYVAFMG